MELCNNNLVARRGETGTGWLAGSWWVFSCGLSGPERVLLLYQWVLHFPVNYTIFHCGSHISLWITVLPSLYVPQWIHYFSPVDYYTVVPFWIILCFVFVDYNIVSLRIILLQNLIFASWPRESVVSLWWLNQCVCMCVYAVAWMNVFHPVRVLIQIH